MIPSRPYKLRKIGRVSLVAPLWVLLVIFCCFSLPANANSRINQNAYTELSTLVLADLEESPGLAAPFSSWLAAIENGDEVEALSGQNGVIAEMERTGARNLTTLSNVAMAAGYKALENNDTSMAFLAAASAIAYAPDYPRAHFFMAWATFSRNKGDIKGVIFSLRNGVQALLRDGVGLKVVMSEVIRYVYIAFIASALLVFIALLFAHGRAFFAQISSLAPGVNAPSQHMLIGVLAMAAPFAWGGITLFVLALPLFLWPYMRSIGKGYAVALGVVILLTPNIVEFMARGKALATADTYQALYLLSQNTWDGESLRAIEKAALNDPESEVLSTALGIINKSRGQKRKALAAYDTILAKKKENLRALVNKGNVYFLHKEFSKAVHYYVRATESHPNSVIAHFNLSKAYFEMYKTEASEDSWAKAQAIDAGMTAQLDSKAELGFAHRVSDFPINDADLQRYERELPEQIAAHADNIWIGLFGGLSRQVFRIISVVFLALLVVSNVVWGKIIAHQSCSSCGVTFKPPVALTSETPRCNQCVAASIRTKGVASATHDKKRKEMRKFREGRGRLASLLDRLAPGAGRLYFQESGGGLFFCFTTALFAVAAAFTIMLEIDGGAQLTQEVVMRNGPLVGGVALYWILMNTVFVKDME